MWIYPVDMKRTNEFGQVFEKEKDNQPEDNSIKSESKEEIEKDIITDSKKVKRRVRNQS